MHIQIEDEKIKTEAKERKYLLPKLCTQAMVCPPWPPIQAQYIHIHRHKAPQKGVLLSSLPLLSSERPISLGKSQPRIPAAMEAEEP